MFETGATLQKANNGARGVAPFLLGNATPRRYSGPMQPIIGQIIMFSGNFAPRGWMLCDGQSLNIADYRALYDIIGTKFGGDGVTVFDLPDMRGRTPMHPGQGFNMTLRALGDGGGTEIPPLTTVMTTPGGVAVYIPDEGTPQGNMQPFRCVNFIIALCGIVPSRAVPGGEGIASEDPPPAPPAGRDETDGDDGGATEEPGAPDPEPDGGDPIDGDGRG